MYRTFEEIASAAKLHPEKRRMAVAGAADKDVLASVVHAKRENLVEPILVGQSGEIKELLRSLDENPSDYVVENAPEGEEAQRSVDLVKTGDVHVLMKGMIETSAMLRPVVKRENNLRTGALMSHVVFFDKIPHYNKLLLQTDGGVVMYPTLEDKKGIIENAVNTLHVMGNPNPTVAVLAAIEKVNPKMIESVEAAALKEMNQRGELPGCIVEGPISYDIAMSAAIAKHKGYDCPYCGDFDVLIVPNMTCGNILSKSWVVTAGALMAGVIMGAKVPVVLTSRGATPEEKYYSIALAAVTTRS